jgi:hypothetical protein
MGAGNFGGNSMKDILKIGIGVEGPSDKKFLDSLLKREYPKIRFHIQNMGCRTKLMRNASQLLNQWKECNFDAGFILIDCDKSICASQVVGEFERSIQEESRKYKPDRFLSVIVAIKEIEAWFLSDEQAIHSIFSQSDYNVPVETGAIGAEGLLKKFWKKERKSSINKISFAETIALYFNPQRAMPHSESFAYFWSRLQETLNNKETG